MAATGRIPVSLVNKIENIDHKSGHMPEYYPFHKKSPIPFRGSGPPPIAWFIGLTCPRPKRHLDPFSRFAVSTKKESYKKIGYRRGTARPCSSTAVVIKYRSEMNAAISSHLVRQIISIQQDPVAYLA